MQNPFGQCCHQRICVCLTFLKWRHYRQFLKLTPCDVTKGPCTTVRLVTAHWARCLIHPPKPLTNWMLEASFLGFFLRNNELFEASSLYSMTTIFFRLTLDLFDTRSTQRWANILSNEFIMLSSEDTRTSSGNQLAWLKRCCISLLWSGFESSRKIYKTAFFYQCKWNSKNFPIFSTGPCRRL